MAKHEPSKRLSEEERRAVFTAVVEAQDAGKGVVLSRKEVAERFGISDRQVRQIEQEGIDGGWPPLG
jgi:DNA-directed RNA polymerase sigma subunit (sigma70/sigma32)